MSVVLNGTTDYLSTTTVPASDEPFTISIWFKANDITNAYTVASLNNSGTDIHDLQVAGSLAGDPVRANTYKTTWAVSATTTGYTASTWHHACGVWASDTSRSVYLDGAGKNTNTDNKALNTLTSLLVGAKNALVPTSFFAGKLAHCAVWNIALSDAEVADLAAGVSPLNIQAANLIDFWTLDTDATDTQRSNTLSATGSPTYDGADNPNVSAEMTWQRILVETMPTTTPSFSSLIVADDGYVGNGATNPRWVFDNAGYIISKSTDVYLYREASSMVFGAQIASATATHNFSHNTFRSRGTLASPAAVGSADALYYFVISGYDGAAWRGFGALKFDVDGAVSSGTLPIRMTFHTGTTALAERMRITSTGLIGINNVTSPAAQVHIDQSSTTAAIPVLTLDQADVDKPFIKLIGTAAAATLTNSIVDVGDVTTATVAGYVQVNVQDDGNQIADQNYYLPLYTLV